MERREKETENGDLILSFTVKLFITLVTQLRKIFIFISPDGREAPERKKGKRQGEERREQEREFRSRKREQQKEPARKQEKERREQEERREKERREQKRENGPFNGDVIKFQCQTFITSVTQFGIIF